MYKRKYKNLNSTLFLWTFAKICSVVYRYVKECLKKLNSTFFLWTFAKICSTIHVCVRETTKI